MKQIATSTCHANHWIAWEDSWVCVRCGVATVDGHHEVQAYAQAS